MRVNEYNSLDEFVEEYSSGHAWETETSPRKYIGIEFCYNDVYYRMCREPHCDIGEYEVYLPDGRPGLYDVLILHCRKYGYPTPDDTTLVGWYADLDDVLENCVLQGKPFREVIIDDSTEILSKD